MPGDAVQGFVVIASACMIILTILAIGVSVVLIRATLEVRSLVRLVRGEADALRSARLAFGHRARTAGRWAVIFLRKAARRHGNH